MDGVQKKGESRWKIASALSPDRGGPPREGKQVRERPIAARIASAWRKIKFRYKTNIRALARASTVTSAGAEEIDDLFTAAICGYATSAVARALPVPSPLPPRAHPLGIIYLSRTRIGDVLATLAANLSWIQIPYAMGEAASQYPPPPPPPRRWKRASRATAT